MAKECFQFDSRAQAEAFSRAILEEFETTIKISDDFDAGDEKSYVFIDARKNIMRVVQVFLIAWRKAVAYSRLAWDQRRRP